MDMLGIRKDNIRDDEHLQQAHQHGEHCQEKNPYTCRQFNGSYLNRNTKKKI